MVTDGVSSLVIDELCDRSVDQNIAVVCFYCDFQIQKMQTPEKVLGALAKQIVRGLGVIPDEIGGAFRTSRSQVGGRGLRVPEALSLLKSAIAPLDRAFICIDALDELLVKHLPTLLRSLHDISQSCPGVRFLFTGRPHIEAEIENYFPGAARVLQMKGTRQDIMRYVEMMLDDDPNPEAMNDSLRAEIMNRVSETISDVYATTIFCSSLELVLIVVPRFLLVSLNITAVLEETTIYDRREQLKTMTSGRGLNDAYDVALDRIKGQTVGKSKLGMAALMWISRSEQPMSPDELCHALGVQIGFTDPNPDCIPSMQTILASCLGLATVDKEESKVRLVNFTLLEYFNSRCEFFQNAYVVMAEVCLTYLNFDCIRRLESMPATEARKYPFLWYASDYWGHYARHETTEGVKSLALHLLDGFESHISASLLLGMPKGDLAGSLTRFTGLHCVAYLGVHEIAEALLDIRDWDVDMADCWGRTPLICASMKGHEGIIEVLLAKSGTTLNKKDRNGRTALCWAALYGQEGAAKLLLERGEVNPESRDNHGRTPLFHAAESGSEGIVKMLLERQEVNPNLQDISGRTPLSHAARSGSEGTLKLLLELDVVNPESQDNYGRTPLSHAAESGSEGIVKMLLDREEVNPESQDKDGRTPLSRAAAAFVGEGAVKLLLELKEVNPESRDNSGRTPLSYAARHGNEGTVELLLKRQDVNPESLDNSGRTPLSHAAVAGGGEEKVELLLKREEVNPDSRDNFGRTPLFHAAGTAGGEGAVKLLLAREEVNPESQDNGGRTPLSHAAGFGSEGTVELLLKRQDVNPESLDNAGRTPLIRAVYTYEGEKIVKLLLAHQEVNPEWRDNTGRTPLSHAVCAYEGEKVVKLLLAREEVNPESRDNSGRTPLSHAAGAGVGEEILKILLGRGEVDLESRDNSGRTPLSHAAGTGGGRTVKFLLKLEGVNPESRDNSGKRPLYYAHGGTRASLSERSRGSIWG